MHYKIMAYTVYMHTTPIGKVYIGITSRPLEVRWKNNGYGYKTQRFYRAITKYGWENIKHEILEENLTEEEAKNKEVFYIEKYNSADPAHGYNMTTGGDGCCGFHVSEETKEKLRLINTGKKHTPEQIEKIRASCTGWKQSDEAKAKISFTHKGKPKSKEHKEKLRLANIGKHHTEETRRKLSESHKGRKLNKNQLEALARYNRRKINSAETRAKISANSKNKKKVVCVETGQVFDTVKDVSAWLGMSPNAVSNAVCGYAERAGGYHWKYYHEEDQDEHRSTTDT